MSVCGHDWKCPKKHRVAASQPGFGSSTGSQTATLKIWAVTLSYLQTWTHYINFLYLFLPLQKGITSLESALNVIS